MYPIPGSASATSSIPPSSTPRVPSLGTSPAWMKYPTSRPPRTWWEPNATEPEEEEGEKRKDELKTTFRGASIPFLYSSPSLLSSFRIPLTMGVEGREHGYSTTTTTNEEKCVEENEPSLRSDTRGRRCELSGDPLTSPMTPWRTEAATAPFRRGDGSVHMERRKEEGLQFHDREALPARTNLPPRSYAEKRVPTCSSPLLFSSSSSSSLFTNRGEAWYHVQKKESVGAEETRAGRFGREHNPLVASTSYGTSTTAPASMYTLSSSSSSSPPPPSSFYDMGHPVHPSWTLGKSVDTISPPPRGTEWEEKEEERKWRVQQQPQEEEEKTYSIRMERVSSSSPLYAPHPSENIQTEEESSEEEETAGADVFFGTTSSPLPMSSHSVPSLLRLLRRYRRENDRLRQQLSASMLRERWLTQVVLDQHLFPNSTTTSSSPAHAPGAGAEVTATTTSGAVREAWETEDGLSKEVQEGPVCRRSSSSSVSSPPRGRSPPSPEKRRASMEVETTRMTPPPPWQVEDDDAATPRTCPPPFQCEASISSTRTSRSERSTTSPHPTGSCSSLEKRCASLSSFLVKICNACLHVYALPHAPLPSSSRTSSSMRLSTARKKTRANGRRALHAPASSFSSMDARDGDQNKGPRVEEEEKKDGEPASCLAALLWNTTQLQLPTTGKALPRSHRVEEEEEEEEKKQDSGGGCPMTSTTEDAVKEEMEHTSPASSGCPYPLVHCAVQFLEATLQGCGTPCASESSTESTKERTHSPKKKKMQKMEKERRKLWRSIKEELTYCEGVFMLLAQEVLNEVEIVGERRRVIETLQRELEILQETKGEEDMKAHAEEWEREVAAEPDDAFIEEEEMPSEEEKQKRRATVPPSRGPPLGLPQEEEPQHHHHTEEGRRRKGDSTPFFSPSSSSFEPSAALEQQQSEDEVERGSPLAFYRSHETRSSTPKGTRKRMLDHFSLPSPPTRLEQEDCAVQ